VGMGAQREVCTGVPHRRFGTKCNF
jgi:hypothetical protein